MEYFTTDLGTLYQGDSIEVLQTMPDNLIDTVITDPPYGLSNHSEKLIREVMAKWLQGEEDYVPAKKGFMGKAWDGFVPPPALWREVYRVMKPGATILVFAGTRTYDLMTLSLRLAGFEIKDTLMWLYGSGFPKSQDISKMIDKKMGAEREIVGVKKDINHVERGDKNIVKQTRDYSNSMFTRNGGKQLITAPATPEAKQWDGWKSHGLKPAYEPIIMAMKPNEGSYAENALKWGVSGLNIDEARVGNEHLKAHASGKNALMGGLKGGDNSASGYMTPERQGRFPANILLDEEAAKMLDEQSGDLGISSGGGNGYAVSIFGTDTSKNRKKGKVGFNDRGGASRFFYTAKASKRERGEFNNHPTVKPLKLIEYLCKLTKTPTGGVVLDPFLGSGTTALACEKVGRRWVGIEFNEEYCEIAKRRLLALEPVQSGLFG